MADKPNQGYIEQLREMRALRTQQLRQQGADKAFYSSMNSSQKMLLRSNEKMIASMENMSRSILSGFKGLAVSIGGIAGKGVSAAAGGVSDIAGSIAGGLTRVLPIAIAGVLAKVLFWDNLTEDSKDKLTKSAANLFQSIFGNVPEYLGKMINGIKGQLESLNISSPLLSALSKKAGQFVDVLTAGFDVIKPFFDNIINFVSKDPAELIKNSLKAIGVSALSALLLPTAASLLMAMLRNSMLMSMINNSLSNHLGGGRSGPVIVGGPGQNPNTVPRTGPQGQAVKPYGNGAAQAAAARAAALEQAGARTAWAVAKRVGARAAGVLFGPVGILLSLGWAAYDIVDMLSSEGFKKEDIKEALKAHRIDTLDMDIAGIQPEAASSIMKADDVKNYDQAKKRVDASDEYNAPSREDVNVVQRYEKYQQLMEDLNNQRLEEMKADTPGFVRDRIAAIWGSLTKDQKREYIENHLPLMKTANFVYFMEKNGKIGKDTIDNYYDLMYGDPDFEKVDPDKLTNSLQGLVKSKESKPIGGESSSYDVVYGNGKYGRPGIPLTQMTGAEVQEYQKQLVAATKKDNVAGGRGTGAVGAYQATQTTLADFYNDPANAGLKDQLFNEEVQDAFFKWRINKDMTDYMSGKITKDQFVNKISGIWEAFGKNPEYKKELAALIDDPSKYTSTSANLSDQQKATQQAANIAIFKKKLADLASPLGDTTPAIVNGTDVAKVIKDSTVEAVDAGKKGVGILSKILSTPGNIDFKEVFNNFESLTDELDSKFQEIYKAQNGKQVSSVSDNSTTMLNINNSTGGGGGGINVAQVKSNHDYNTAFNSLAGGRLSV